VNSQVLDDVTKYEQEQLGEVYDKSARNVTVITLAKWISAIVITVF